MRLLPSTCMTWSPFFSRRALSTFFSTLSSMVCIRWLMVAPLFGFSRAPLHGSLCSHGSSLSGCWAGPEAIQRTSRCCHHWKLALRWRFFAAGVTGDQHISVG